ncbi:HpcH/HpaI aldolase/citrate lyase family protein [Dactylonectria macrodidyma]|uniref:HpcH/HpaI aldolase/citrate lyase family protein n=1 Tax=Dactylonectria macrodidyma TaxID=307937 RepID=A0A9P9EQ56_9HYPO|nr:HpcH/HpaI aldolase/citrate lyase family protein [Dactylonectria macrodidyma]
MQHSSPIKIALAKTGKPSFGVWQMMPGANLSRLMARSAGIDWVMIDCEHGNIDDAAMHEAVPAIATVGVSPIVRISDVNSWMVKRALDSGAHGILVPLARSVQQVKDLVKSTKFPPQGSRGFGSPFTMQCFSPKPTMGEYLQQANDSLLTIVQIETQEALNDVDMIAAVDGLDVLFIGPFDLGNNIGHPIIDGDMSKELKAAVAQILAATHKAGKKCGIFCSSGEQARRFAQEGFDMINVITDFSALQSKLNESVSCASGSPMWVGRNSY